MLLASELASELGYEFTKRLTTTATHIAGQQFNRAMMHQIFTEEEQEQRSNVEVLPSYLICVDNSQSDIECQNAKGVIEKVSTQVKPEDVGAFIGGVAGCTLFYFAVPAPISMGGMLAFVFGNAVFGEISQGVGKYLFKKPQKKGSSAKIQEGLYEFAVLVEKEANINGENVKTAHFEQHDFSNPDAESTYIESRVKTFPLEKPLSLVDDYQPRSYRNLSSKAEKPKLKTPLIVPVTKQQVNQSDLNQSLLAKLAKQGKLNMVLFNENGEIQFIYYKGSIEGLELIPEQPKLDKEALLKQLFNKLNISPEKPAESDSTVDLPHMDTICKLFEMQAEHAKLLRSSENNAGVNTITQRDDSLCVIPRASKSK